MDWDKKGIEKELEMVKLKKIDGGGYLKIIKREVKEEMRKIGY